MLSITRYDPLGDLFDGLVKDFFARPVLRTPLTSTRSALKVDVAEDDGSYTVLAEIPGVKKEDIEVAIDGDEVSISAAVREEKDVKNGDRVIHSERHYGKLSRALRFGAEIDEAKAEAKYSDGVLELRLPKKTTNNVRRLTIQ